MRHFWVFTSASAVSKLGNTFLNVAMPWILLQVTGSALVAAASFGVQLAPYALSPAFGVLVDRFDRRRVFIWAEVAQCLLVALLPLLVYRDSSVPVLILLFLIGCGSLTSELTSDFGLIPELAPADSLTKAYSWYTTTVSIVRFVGPAVVGVVIGTLGARAALWIDAATFLATAGAALTLPLRPAPNQGPSQFRHMLRNGFSSFWRLRRVRRLTAALAVFNLGAGAVPTVLIVLAQTHWGWGPQVAGAALGVGALGAAAGAWITPRVARGKGLEARIGIWFCVCGLGGALMLFGSAPAVIAGFTLLSMGEGGMNVTTNEYRYTTIAKDLLGRVNAIIRAVIITGAATSSLVLGATAEIDSPCLWLAPVLAGGVLAWGIWATRSLPATSVPASAPEPPARTSDHGECHDFPRA
ncbi:MFS transporter [Streptomyces pathocidini]|uniref:MFS transporter n=1 Tax=Streptomyces pathocidini TaxID=1650571 RepID=A0ABW7UK11_9ACTN|nr:MFS transporter [Streptomyces pathocidini]